MNIGYTLEMPMGHRLQNHPGKCRFLHGHNYLITVTLLGLPDTNTGMIIDFHDLKHDIHTYFKDWDHAFVVEENDPCTPVIDQWAKVISLPLPPTAEILAETWKQGLQSLFNPLTVTVRVRETQDCEVLT